MESWMFFAFTAFLFYGLWAFFPKLGSNYINPQSFIIYQIIGVSTVAFLFLFSMGTGIDYHAKGIMFAVLTGIFGALGTIFFLNALRSGGKTPVVVMITALYPFITIILSTFFLKEVVSFQKWIGIFFSLLALVFFSL